VNWMGRLWITVGTMLADMGSSTVPFTGVAPPQASLDKVGRLGQLLVTVCPMQMLLSTKGVSRTGKMHAEMST